MKKNRFLVILGVTAAILLIPFIAMQFTTEVSWGLGDFVIAGAMLLGTGVLLDFTIRKIPSRKYRILVCALLVAAFLLTWAELAVGIFGTSFAGS